MALFLASDAFSKSSQQLGLITMCSTTAVMSLLMYRENLGLRSQVPCSRDPYMSSFAFTITGEGLHFQSTAQMSIFQGQSIYMLKPNQVKKEGYVYVKTDKA